MYSVNIEIYGEVVKHGFLPSVWLLVPEYQLSGWIAYDGDHALMQAQGDVEQIKQFIRDLPKKMRPWYQIREVIVKSSGIKDDPKVRQPFKILEAPGEFPAIRPDHTLCPTCPTEYCGHGQAETPGGRSRDRRVFRHRNVSVLLHIFCMAGMRKKPYSSG